MSKILVGKTSDIPSGKMIMVSTDGKDILVTNVDGNYYAMDDTCSHAGASLSEGSLNGSTLVCPWHGALGIVRQVRWLNLAYSLRI